MSHEDRYVNRILVWAIHLDSIHYKLECIFIYQDRLLDMSCKFSIEN